MGKSAVEEKQRMKFKIVRSQEHSTNKKEHVALLTLILVNLGAPCSMIGLVERYWKPIAAVINNNPADARSVRISALIP
jgi:hypothetical protein